MRRLLLAALTLALLTGAGPAKRHHHRHDPFAGVQTADPRSGPGSRALARLAKCIRKNDYACVDDALAGSEMIVRATAHDLATSSAPPMRVLANARRLAAMGGRTRVEDLLSSALSECATSLDDAVNGRCDDTGRGHLARPDAKEAPADMRKDVLALGEVVGGGIGRRRVRRLVCGPQGFMGKLSYEEALVVLGHRRKGGDTILDVRCKDIGAPADEQPIGMKTRAPLVPAPDSSAVTGSIAHATQCIDDPTGGCSRSSSPMTELVARDFAERLARAGTRRRQRLLEELRELAAASPSKRARWLASTITLECGDIRRFELAARCRAGAETPAPPVPVLPRDLGAGQAAQARALLAIVRHRAPGGTRVARRIVCGDLDATAVFARRPGRPDALVDLRCTKP